MIPNECEDQNNLLNDGCSSDCQVELGFKCKGVPSICESECGDGIQAFDEECDDSN